jgi:hypothetical protein
VFRPRENLPVNHVDDALPEDQAMSMAAIETVGEIARREMMWKRLALELQPD